MEERIQSYRNRSEYLCEMTYRIEQDKFELLNDVTKEFKEKFGKDRIFFEENDEPRVEYTNYDEEIAEACSVLSLHLNDGGTADEFELQFISNGNETLAVPISISEGICNVVEAILNQLEKGEPYEAC